MKKFFSDFKKFISRGNIMDLAVGVIIGGAFSAIVTALTNQILMPLINWLIGGAGGLESARTILGVAQTLEDGVTIDWANTLYIDWGAFISAIINFLLIALILFIILKVAMKSSEILHNAKEAATKGMLSKEDKKQLKARGISPKDSEAVKAYFEEKEAKEAAAKAEADAKAQAEAEEAKKNSTEYLLKEIRDLLKENKELKSKAKK